MCGELPHSRMFPARPPIFFLVFILVVCGLIAKAWAACGLLCPDAMPIRPGGDATAGDSTGEQYFLVPSDPNQDNVLRCV